MKCPKCKKDLFFAGATGITRPHYWYYCGYCDYFREVKDNE